MVINISLSLLPGLLFLAIALIPTYAILRLFKFRNRTKKSPINIYLLRGPGESLKEQIQDCTSDIIISMLFIPIGTLLFYSVSTTQYIISGNKLSPIQGLIYTFCAIVLVAYFFLETYKLVKKRNSLRLGYDCELTVGQELNNRLKDGYHLFHDFPAEGFNIDHILIGNTGVFAIETKGRSKEKEAKDENWKLQFDGHKLILPSRTETKPIDQAVRQAKWLSQWLQKATGMPCSVEPVLAIPGWYIERTGPSNFKLYNGKNSIFLTKGKNVLTSQQIQAICYQIEQKCRSVRSSAYKDPEEKEGKI